MPLLSQELLQNVSDGEETGEVESPAPPPPPDHPPPSSAEEHSSVEEHSSADEFLEEEEEPLGLGAETGAEASLWAGAHQHPGWVWAEPAS